MSDAISITEETPFAVLRKTWQPVMRSIDLSSGGVAGATLLGEALVLARFPDGRLLAAPEACPHKGMALSCGSVHDDRLVCPYHGWAFGEDGACVGVPSLPDPPARLLEHAALRTFAVQERYGLIWVRLSDDEAAPLPDLPVFDGADGWDVLVPPPMPFACGFRREIENYLDMTHFSFAHGQTLGAAADAVLPPLDIQRLPDGGFEMNAPFPALRAPGITPTKLQSAHHRHQRGYMPNFTTIRQTFEDGDERMLFHVPSPVTPTSCLVFWAVAQPRTFDGPPLADQLAFSTQVLEEDRYMCERQIPKEVPVAPGRGGWGVLVAPGDTLANTFQKTFRSFLEAHA
ncbi:MAG: aromatic ring-hydroxylating dioxygenase subunit alpha [Bacteroidetes bacterium]|nr:aromatic ring-hydroxylating dioxygenase subunit alpha [Bacteroidota bacterium]